MQEKIQIKTPGRICLFGDHQDYLGLPIISATINRYMYLEATPIDEPKLHLELPDLKQTQTIALADPCTNKQPHDYFRGGIAVLKREGICLQRGYRICIQGDIPINAGLSSSSAVVVAWIRFLLKAATPGKSYTNEQIAHWAYATEVLEFNTPGGMMDQYTIAMGGLIYLDTQTGAYKRLPMLKGAFLLGVTHIKKETNSILHAIKEKSLDAIDRVKKEDPAFDLQASTLPDVDRFQPILPRTLFPYWSAAIKNYDITKQAHAALLNPPCELSYLGGLMNAHQKILDQQLRNTPKPMAAHMRIALLNGAFGAKIVGSGGGGCFVVLTSQENQNRVEKALNQSTLAGCIRVELTPAHEA